MALAAPVTAHRNLGHVANLPVLAAAVIYEGAALSVDADGFVHPLVGTDVHFVGFALESVTNSGASGTVTVAVDVGDHLREIPLASVAAADAGEVLYATADDTFTKTSTNAKIIGVIMAVAKTNVALVQVKPYLTAAP